MTLKFWPPSRWTSMRRTMPGRGLHSRHTGSAQTLLSPREYPEAHREHGLRGGPSGHQASPGTEKRRDAACNWHWNAIEAQAVAPDHVRQQRMASSSAMASVTKSWGPWIGTARSWHRAYSTLVMPMMHWAHSGIRVTTGLVQLQASMSFWSALSSSSHWMDIGEDKSWWLSVLAWKYQSLLDTL